MANSKQVVIAGAGPVGCVVALILSRAGISVQMLEAEAELAPDLRASTFHPPTLDMLDGDLGVTPQLIELGLITPKFQYRDRDEGLIVEFDLDLIKDQTGHPYRLQCEQFKFTRVIAAMLTDYPDTEILFNAKVTGLSQLGDGVTVHYDMPDGPREITCDYLIGCEGSRSVVRKALDIDFPGFTYPEHFAIVSVSDAVDKIVPDMGHIAYIAHPQEWCALIHAPDFWRFMIPVSLELSQEEAHDEAFLQRRLKRLIAHDGDFTIGHRNLYKVNQRVAETYRAGRVTLAGDSAHVNNPLGGMGMNGGIHDGFNVAEKLIEIINNGADEALLDRYDRQRRPIAVEYVQQQSIRNKKLIEETDPAVRKKAQDELRAIADDREKSVDLMLRTSMFHAVWKSAELA